MTDVTITGSEERSPAGIESALARNRARKETGALLAAGGSKAGIDIGLTTVQQWPANGLLPDTDTAASTPVVERGVGPDPPPGGYRPSDLIFFGHGAGDAGHVALWLGNGLIVQCSGSDNGANIRPLAGYVTPTGWVRWRAVSG